MLWRKALPSPNFGCATVANDVVFTVTYNGEVYAFQTKSGARLWSVRAPAGVNACPAVAGNMLIVGAGVLPEGSSTAQPAVVAYRLMPSGS